MKNKLLIAGVSAFVLMVAVTAVSAGQNHWEKKYKRFSPENHTAIMEALENNDYEVWKEIMGDKPMAEKITEENFPQFVQMHNLMQEGKYEEAKEIREDLGLPGKRGLGKAKGKFLKHNKEGMKKFCERFMEEDN